MVVVVDALLADVYGGGDYGTNGVYSASGTGATSSTSSSGSTGAAGPTKSGSTGGSSSTQSAASPSPQPIQLTQNGTATPKSTVASTPARGTDWGLWISVLVTVLALGALTFMLVLAARRRRHS